MDGPNSLRAIANLISFGYIRAKGDLIMKNGNYILVIAPKNFPGLKYRKRYCLEHHLIYWQHTGIIPSKTQIIHHINENRFDNRFENLQLMEKKDHSKLHRSQEGRKWVELKCPYCGKIFQKPENETFFAKRSRLTFCSRSCAGKFKFSNDLDYEKLRTESLIKKFKKFLGS